MLMDALLSHVSLHIDSALCAVISLIWIPVAPYFLPVTLPRMLANANTLFHVDTPIPLFTGIAAVMLCGAVRQPYVTGYQQCVVQMRFVLLIKITVYV